MHPSRSSDCKGIGLTPFGSPVSSGRGIGVKHLLDLMPRRDGPFDTLMAGSAHLRAHGTNRLDIPLSPLDLELAVGIGMFDIETVVRGKTCGLEV